MTTTNCRPSSSTGNVLPLIEEESDISQKQGNLACIKKWVETDAGFYGRTDEDFLLMFLRACEFDIEMTKTTLKCYYESRRDISQWWANRNVKDDNIFSILPYRAATVLIDGDIHQPTVLFSILSRGGPNLNNFDDNFKLTSLVMETAVRRRNCQLNGLIWLMDCRDFKWWLALRCLNPVTAKKLAYSFYKSLPVRMKSIVLLNAPAMASTAIRLYQTLLPRYLKAMVHIYGTDWSRLGEHVPLELLPEEYGGQAGPMEQHDDAFVGEILALNDYIVDDNKYGFQ